MRWVRTLFRLLRQSPIGAVGAVILLVFVIAAIFAPLIAPYDPIKTNFHPEGGVVRREAPSRMYWFGTNHMGRDIFSQVVYGSRVALVVGILASLMVVFIGGNIGVISGYYGGRIDNVIMRITDVFYGLPFLPFALVLVALFKPGIGNVIITVSLLTWRTTARVVRSRTLSVKHRAFVDAARVSGASNLFIIYRHIVPNVLPIALIYVPLTMSTAIMAEASLSFLGYGDPLLMSWGKTLYESWIDGTIFTAWWWTIPPGVSIMLLTLSGFGISRAVEELTDPRLRRVRRGA